MAKNSEYDFLFILIGAVSLYIGLRGKKPTYGGGIVRKYVLIAIGILFVVYGLLSFLFS